MSDMIVKLARRLEETTTAENDYHYGREDGSPGLCGRMWGDIKPHEVSRLPMIYGVAWDMTGDDHWRGLFRLYTKEAVELAVNVDLSIVPKRPCYGLYQHQYAMETLVAIEREDAALRDVWRRFGDGRRMRAGDSNF